MLKRVAISVVIGAALFGAVSTGMLVRHRRLRMVAVELVRFDLDVLVAR